MDFSAGAHRLTPADASGVTFQSGATFTANTSFSGNAFGTVNNSSVAFANGSTYVAKAGGNPFGSSSGGAAVFQTGSKYSHQVAGAPSLSGRTYADFEYNVNSSQSGTGSSALSIDNLTVLQGTLSIGMTGSFNVKGNVTVTGNLTLNAASTATINFSGTSVQTISGAGTLTINGTEQLFINSGSTVTIQRSIPTLSGTTVTVNGRLNCPSGYAVTGAGNFTLAAGATLSIGSTTGITWATTAGTIQVTGTRSYSSSANYVYANSGNVNTGDGLDHTSPSANTVYSLTIANGVNNTVTLNSASPITISGPLQINSGILSLTGSSTAGTLSFDSGATAQATGTWGASGASHIDTAHFAGSGTVNVLGGSITVGSATQYRSISSGNWDSPATWEASNDGTTWTTVYGGVTPGGTTFTANPVTIRSPYNVTYNLSSLPSGSVGNVTVDSGATLGMGTTANVGDFLSIAGNLVNNGTIAAASGSSTSPTHKIIFSGTSGTSTWTGSGDISSPKCALTINSGVTLDISGLTTALKFKNTGSAVNLTINGTLIAGSQVINQNGSAGTLTVSSGATVQCGNANGLINSTSGTFNWPLGATAVNIAANYTFNGSAAQVTLGMPTTVNNLTMNNASGVTLSASTTVNGTLAFTSGKITTGANTLTLGSTGAVSGAGAGKYVYGTLAKTYSATGPQTFTTFDVGDSVNYTPVSLPNLNISTLGGTPTLTASTVANHNGNSQYGSSGLSTSKYVERMWTLTAGGTLAGTYDITLNFVSGDLIGSPNTANLLVGKYSGGWTSPTIGTRTSTSTSATGLSGFSNFVIGEPSGGVASVDTLTAVAITDTTATLGATVQADGGSSITDYGIVWGLSANPTTADNTIPKGTSVTPPSIYTVSASGLNAGTLIHYRGYAVNTTGTGYSADGSFYTLSTEPSAHVGSFSGTAASTTSINLSWSAAAGANGYLILQRGGASAPTGAPSDATGYSVGNTLGDGTVAAIIAPGSATSTTISSGLTAGAQYSFAIFPFAWDGAIAGTYNYRTAATVPTASVTTQYTPKYRSLTSGNWGDFTTWERSTDNGGTWAAATSGQTPTSADDTVTILNTHTVSVAASVTADQVTVNSGGTLTVSSGQTLTLANGTGTDLDVSGTLTISGTVDNQGQLVMQTGSTSTVASSGILKSSGAVTSTASTLTIASGGKYQHNQNGGTIPTMTWGGGSTCEILGVTSTVPSGLNAAFHHLIWNCSSQAAGNLSLGGVLTTVIGDLTIQSTGSGVLINNTTLATTTLTIGGDLRIAGGTFSLAQNTGAIVTTINLGGNYNQSGGTFEGSTGTSASGQQLNFTGGSSPTVSWTQSSGSLDIAKINIAVDTAKTLTLNNGITVATARNFTVNGTLMTGAFKVLGAGTSSFVLGAAGTLGIGDANGIAPLGTASGSIQTTGTRTFPTTASYIYNGSAGQVTGTGLPATVNNLTINNANGVTLTGSVAINGTLTLSSGSFAVGANALVLNGPAIAGTPGNLTTTSSSTLGFGGSSGAVAIPNSVVNLNNLEINNSSGVALQASLTVANILDIESGVLALANGTASTARQLAFSGVTQVSGAWGGTASSASYVAAAQFGTTATGTVNVTGGVGRYYRSAAPGNWDSPATWEMSSDGTTWPNAAGAGGSPGATDSVYIQSGHLVTLSQAAACNDLEISTGTANDAGTVNAGGIGCGTSALSINGSLRAYYGAVGVSPAALPAQTYQTAAASFTPATKSGTSGKLKFIGSTRATAVLESGKWAAFNTAAGALADWEFSLASGQTALVQTDFKTANLTVSSGILDVGIFLARVSGNSPGDGQGNITISSGATVICAGSGDGLRSTTSANALSTITVAGTLKYTSLAPTLPAVNYNFSGGTIEYAGGAQTLLAKSTAAASATDPNAASGGYNNITLSGTGTKTLFGNTTVNGTLTIAADVALAGSGLKLTANGPLDLTGNLTITSGTLLANGTSTGSGTVTLNSSGTLGGTGTVGGSIIVNGTVAAGASIGTLNTGSETWAPGGTNEVEIGAATGTLGLDWDFLNITGDLNVTVTNQTPIPANRFTLRLVGRPGGISSFDKTLHYTWPIAKVSGVVYGFNAPKFNLDTNAVTDELAGAFSLALSNQTVNLIYTPTSCADLTSNSAGVTNGNMNMFFVNASGLTSVQALTLTNCVLYGTNYDGDGNALAPYPAAIGPITLTARVNLHANAKKLLLVAVKVDSGLAVVNAIVMDTCGRGKSFDPVITTLKITSGNFVKQRFEGLLSAEHYLHVINSTPGLKWLEINLNGRVFRLDPLTDGQEISADLLAAMHEGDNNVVVLTGGGDVGASALVMITDTASGNLIALPEIVTLTLSQSSDGLVLAWPDTLAGWQLQANATAQGTWGDVTATPVSLNGQFTVNVPTTSDTQFYRLVGPAPAVTSSDAATASTSDVGISVPKTPTSAPTQRTYDGLLW